MTWSPVINSQCCATETQGQSKIVEKWKCSSRRFSFSLFYYYAIKAVSSVSFFTEFKILNKHKTCLWIGLSHFVFRTAALPAPVIVFACFFFCSQNSTIDRLVPCRGKHVCYGWRYEGILLQHSPLAGPLFGCPPFRTHREGEVKEAEWSKCSKAFIRYVEQQGGQIRFRTVGGLIWQTRLTVEGVCVYVCVHKSL